MNPKNIYNSLKRSISLVKLTLFILLLQVSILFVCNIKIGLPKYASDYIVNLIFLDRDVKLDYDKIKFTVRGDVWFDNLKLYLPDLTGIKCSKGKFSFSRDWILNNQKFPIDNLLLEDFSLQSEKFKFHDLEIEKLESVSLENQYLYFDIKSIFLRNSIGVRGIIAHETSDKDAFKRIKLSSVLESIDKELGQHLDKLRKIKFKNFNLKVIDLYSSTFFLSLDTKLDTKNDNKYLLNSCTGEFTFQENLKCFKGYVSAKSLNYSTDMQSVESQQIKANFLTDKNTTSSTNLITIECGNTQLVGKITGIIEPFDINFNLSETQSNLSFFSSNNSLQSFINYRRTEANATIKGFADINPKYFSLECIKNEVPLKVFSGDQIRLLFCENHSPTDESYQTLFTLEAKDFSAFEVPTGSYNFVGEIKNDLTLEIRKAFGKMGRCVVEGSYSQMWTPLAFEFRLTGNCYPPDINNWFGLWWGKLWENFSFPEEIPYGDFIISGIWAGEIGNAKTFGIVEAGAIEYKNFNTIGSKIVVKVDENETEVSTNNLLHNKGKLSGKLSFPRKHKGSPVLFSFLLDGQYPLNAAREIFGKDFQDTIMDINASCLFCSASGEIYQTSSDSGSQNRFSVNLQTIEPIYIKGFKVKDLYGEVKKDASIITGSFPKFVIADGENQLNFELHSKNVEETVRFKFSLKEANKSLLLQDFHRAKDGGFLNFISENKKYISSQTSNNNSDEGIISLSLQAEGPLSKPLQFEGTGIFHLKETKIGQISILGKISEGLKSFKIPIPSDGFVFNELLLPFELNNETINFDSLSIKGPLSKVNAHGNINLSSGTLDLIAKFSPIGNIPLPVIGNIIELTDPFTKLGVIEITGDYKNPKWKFLPFQD